MTAVATVGARADDGQRQLRLLCTLFFFSGFPALVYQLVWQRALYRIFGVNVEAVTIVVAAFMLGLGLGSLAGGWLSRRARMPLLLLLAAIEGLTAAFGLVSLGIFEHVGQWLAGAPLTVTAGVTLLLVLVPTLLMGATLPVLVGYLSQRLGHVGRSAGSLYYANTLGAGAACLVGAVALFPYLGMRGAVNFAAAVNLAVAVAAVVAHLRRSGAATLGDQATAAPAAPAAGDHGPLLLPLGWVLAGAAAAGFVSLSYEILLFRIISYATASSALAFAITLGGFLVGIAAGARRAAEVTERTPARDLPASVLRAIALATGCGLLLMPLLARAGALGAGLLGVIVAATYLVARFWGFLLPVLMHLGIAADARAGERTAWVYLANIAGSVTGSVLTGFILMDHWGMVQIAQFLVVAGLACSALWWRMARGQATEPRPTLVGGAVVAGLVLAAATPALSEGILESLFWKSDARVQPRFAQTLENRSGIINVGRDGVVYGGGIYDGHYNTDLVHDVNGVLRPYALSLFHPAPRRVLMIGFSSGSWAQIIANLPGLESLTIVEINPGYATLAAGRANVRSVLSHPKVRLIHDDGRRWLQRHPDETFDVVVSNASFHFRAQASNLLSEEFLRQMRGHLREGGILFYNTTGSSRVQRTACGVFPLGARYTNHMVVSDRPMAWDFDRWRGVLQTYQIDGRPVLAQGDPKAAAALERLMALQPQAQERAATDDTTLIEPCSSIMSRTAGLAPVTDDNMGTEWPRLGERDLLGFMRASGLREAR